MRIAFDLDDTLIPRMYSFPTEQRRRKLIRRMFDRVISSPPMWIMERLVRSLMHRLFGDVPLRKGAADLLRSLAADGHDIWIYTTSLRTPFQIRQLFGFVGITPGGIVNGDIHARRVRGLVPELRSTSKYPPAFGIDVLVDDSEGVVLDGKKFGFPVIYIRPDDVNWVGTVREAVRGLCVQKLAA